LDELVIAMGSMISCDNGRCVYGFEGAVVCLNCGVGFDVEWRTDVTAGQLLQLLRIYKMETERLKGKIRVKIHKDKIPTDSFVEVISRKTQDVLGIGDEIFDQLLERDLFESQMLVLDTMGTPCPYCFAQQLKTKLNGDEPCPECNSPTLHRSLVSMPPLQWPDDAQQ